MRRGPLIALVLAVAFAVAFFVMRGKQKTKPAHAAIDAGVARAEPTASRRAAPDARGAPIQPPADAAPLSDGDRAELQQGLSDAHAHLGDALAPCFAGAAVSDRAVVKLHYRLVVAGGAAHAEEPQVTEASEPVVDQIDCMTEAILDASWPTALRDLETPVDDQVLVGELR